LGVRAKLDHVLVPPASVGAELVKSDRGGDVTYHGPGQLVGYPIINIEMGPSAIPCYVHQLEQVIIDSLADLGLPGASRLDGYPGVWIGDRKICAIGVKVSRGRTMHGFALNVDPDMAMFGHIVPCGITDKSVTSLAAEGADVTMKDVVDAVVARFAASFGWTGDDGEGDGGDLVERQDVAWKVRPSDLAPFTRGEGAGEPVRLLGRLAQAGVDSSTSVAIAERKPDWLRAKANLGPEYRALKKTMRSLDLVTVCEEAGCPNIFECWKDGTATFMVLGERCTRACGFCLVDTRHPLAVETDEPVRVAEAVSRMGLAHAVITMVARDDLDDGGASIVAETIVAIRRRVPGCGVEVLISDMKGEATSLDAVFAARPDVLNHNVETVARLQRAVRPSASYARSLAVLARAKAAGLVTKSGLIAGMGESDDEVIGALADLAAVGVDIVTIGQYLRPTSSHLPVDRWVEPTVFTQWAEVGEELGIGHVEASPLTRSSYHARQAASSVALTAASAAPSSR
jgi:lipoic acid synthetase